MRIKIEQPSTIYVQFVGQLPRKFVVTDNNNQVYFERFLNGKTPRIKFNIPYPMGMFNIVTPCRIVKIVPIEIPHLDITLPPFERNRVKDIEIIKNPELNGTPMRIFSMDGIIEKGRDYYKWPKPMRVFYTLHEIAHLYYKTEKFCDLFALVHFLEMGYNMSTAMLCLTLGLRRTPQNMERVLFVYNNLLKTNSIK